MKSNFRFKKAEIGLFNTASSDDVVKSLCNDCHIMGLTMGKFSLIDLIKSILDKVGPADLTIATWSAGIKDAHQVKWMLDTNLIKSIKILTDHSYVNRQKKYAASIENLFGVENIRTSEMHAKFVLISNGSYKITILSSMNLNANKTCETFTIYGNEQIYNFYNEFIDHHFENMKDGFERSSAVVNRCLNSFFSKEVKAELIQKKHWSEQ